MAKRISEGVHIEFSTDGDLWDVDAQWHDRQVGYARCTRTAGRLMLGELRVKDNLPVPWPFLDCLRLLLGIPCRRLDFRKQGIGSRLLERILAEAARAGVTEILGSVTQEDIDKTPALLDWYARHGFTVEEPVAACITTAVRKITLKIGKP